MLRQQVPVPRMLPADQRLDPADAARLRGRRSAGSAAPARRARSPPAARPPSPAAGATSAYICDSYVSDRPLPRRLAAYIATSAFRSRSSAVSSPAGGGDADAGASRAPRCRSAWKGCAHRGGQPLDQHRLCPSGPAHPRSGWRTRRRPAGPRCRPPGRRRWNRSAAAISSRSPSAWPRLSLTFLKSSRSRNSTVIGRPCAARQGQRVAHPVAEQRPVGQPGQRVVEGLVGELLLQPLPLAHVAGVEHDAAHGRVVQQVGGEHLGVERRAVRLAEAATRPARSRPALALRRGRNAAARSGLRHAAGECTARPRRRSGS